MNFLGIIGQTVSTYTPHNIGIPFNVKLPAAKPVGVAGLTESELDTELEKGFADLAQGNIKPASKAFSDIRKDYVI